MPQPLKRQRRTPPPPGTIKDLLGSAVMAAIAQHVRACPHCREKLIAALQECPQARGQLMTIREKKVQLERVTEGVKNLIDCVGQLFS